MKKAEKVLGAVSESIRSGSESTMNFLKKEAPKHFRSYNGLQYDSKNDIYIVHVAAGTTITAGTIKGFESSARAKFEAVSSGKANTFIAFSL